MGGTLFRKNFIVPALITGFCGMTAQVVLLRELLVSFLGSELSIGIILANWLLCEAAGSLLFGRLIEKKPYKVAFFMFITLVFSLCLPPALYCARCLKSVFGLLTGEGLGVIHMVVISLITLAPVSFFHGALFIFASRIQASLSGAPSKAVGYIYIYEVIGTAAGGVVFTFLLLLIFNSTQVLMLVICLNLLLCGVLAGLFPDRRTKALGVISIGVLMLTGFFVVTEKIEKMDTIFLKKQWQDLNVIYHENSPYGNVTVTRREEQYNFFSDGTPVITLPTPDIASAEEMAHFPLLFHPSPKEILVIGGGADGVIREIRKHGVRRIDYVELDPLLFQALKELSPSYFDSEIDAATVNVEHVDGRYFLERTEHTYDCVLLGLPAPSDLQLNRFFSLDFFTLVKTRINKPGLLAFRLPGSLIHMHEELVKLNASVLRAAEKTFDHVLVIPGYTNIYLCSDSLQLDQQGAETVYPRYIQRRINGQIINPFYINFKFEPYTMQVFNAVVSGAETPPNRDFVPRAVFHTVNHWNAQFSPRLYALFKKTGGVNLFSVLLCCAALFLLFLPKRKLPGKARIRYPLVFAILSTGFAGMLFDLMLVSGFQVLYGYVYHRIGMIIAVFLGGTGVGGMLATRNIDRIKRKTRTFIFLETGILAFALVLPVLCTLMISLTGSVLYPFMEAVFYGLGITGGMLIGFEFPLAVNILSESDHHLSRTVGTLNASDLCGGWLAGFLGGVIIIPLFGFIQTGVVLALLKVTALLLLFTVFVMQRNMRMKSSSN